MALSPKVFGISGNSLPGIITGAVVNTFTSDYTLEKTEKELTGNPPDVIDVRMTNLKYKHVMNITAAFTSLATAQTIVDALNTDVTASISSLDQPTAGEGITGKLTKATITGHKDDWWEVSLTIEAIMTKTVTP